MVPIGYDMALIVMNRHTDNSPRSAEKRPHSSISDPLEQPLWMDEHIITPGDANLPIPDDSQLFLASSVLDNLAADASAPLFNVPNTSGLLAPSSVTMSVYTCATPSASPPSASLIYSTAASPLLTPHHAASLPPAIMATPPRLLVCPAASDGGIASQGNTQSDTKLRSSLILRAHEQNARALAERDYNDMILQRGTPPPQDASERRRRVRNKSAFVSRQSRKHYADLLANHLQSVEAERNAAHAECDSASAEIAQLRGVLESMRPRPPNDGPIPPTLF